MCILCGLKSYISNHVICRVRLIAKLFIIMGVLWVTEFLSWVAHYLWEDKQILLIWIFLPFEIINKLQGIAIFVIFVCKQNTINLLKEKFKWVNVKGTLVYSQNGATTNSRQQP